jgi:hypothetical protein
MRPAPQLARVPSSPRNGFAVVGGDWRDNSVNQFRKKTIRQRRSASPAVATVPATTMPPVTPVPVAVTPVHFLGLETVHLVGGGKRGLDGFFRGRQVSAFRERIWRKRCCLRACGKRRGAGGSAKSEFQKVTTFHDISSFA